MNLGFRSRAPRLQCAAGMLLVMLGWFASAQDTPPSGSYVLTLKASAQAGVGRSAAEQVARTYGGELIQLDGALASAYVVKVDPSRARMMAVDHRVAALTPATTAAAAAVWTPGLTYAYDGSGNIKQAGADTFTYDAFNRLKESTVSGVTRTYTYDAYGNRTNCHSGSVPCEEAAPVDAATNRINATGVEYDTRGNLTKAPNGHIYAYDALNAMTTDTAPGGAVREFVYTVGGERLAVHHVAGQWWNWTVRGLDNKVLREFTSRDGTDGSLSSSEWKWTKDYIWRDSHLLATVQPNADRTGTRTYHYHVDHLGTPRVITDQDGRIAGVHDYHPFGSETAGATNETPLTAMKFTGHERDTTTGQSLDYMHARFYSAGWARFLSVDPYLDTKRHLQKPQGWNRYSYVENNSINATDPTGRAIETPWDVLNVGLGLVSLGANIASGNVVGALVDAGGVAVDVGATLVPGLPGGASTAIRAARLAATKGDDVARAMPKLLTAAKMMDHHLMPRQFQKFFAGRGINIDKFTVTLSETTHLKGLHGKGFGDLPGGWNKQWGEWIRNNPKATQKDIYQQLGKMMDEFKLNDLPIHEYRK